MLSNCGNWTAIATAEDGVILAVPLRCHSWACPQCAKHQKRRLLERLTGVKVYSLLTLTCNTAHFPDRLQAFEQMSKAVNLLFKRLRRSFPQADIQYFLIWETTSRGWPHAHLLLRAPFIPQAHLSSLWAELAGSPIVDVRRIHDPDSVVSYIAKYLSKRLDAPPGFKRHRCSRRFLDEVLVDPRDPNRAKLYWTLTPSTTLELGRSYAAGGMTCRISDDGSLKAYPPGHPNKPLMDSFALWPVAFTSTAPRGLLSGFSSPPSAVPQSV